MKKIFLAILVIAGLITGTWLLIKQPSSSSSSSSQCQTKEMIFYYLDTCGWCQKVKNEGTISKIEQLGVNVKQINAAVGPVRHQFEGTPTFVINEKVYSGYKTFDELKELLNCSVDSKQSFQGQDQTPPPSQTEKDFLGEKGEKVVFENGEVKTAVSQFDNNQARFFNVNLNNKTVYFFVIKDKNGIYRAAANACAVCFKTYKGFRQEGDEIVCNNCGNRYPIEKIGTEKGGCNPGPINPNLEVKNSQVIVKQTDLEQVLSLF